MDRDASRRERLALLRQCSGMHSSLRPVTEGASAVSPEPAGARSTVGLARRRLLSSPAPQQRQPVTALPPAELVLGAPRRRAASHHSSKTKQLPAGVCALRIRGSRETIGDGSAANARVIEFFNGKGAHALFNRLVAYIENTQKSMLRGRYKNRHLQPMVEFFAPEFRRARIAVFVCSQPTSLIRPSVKWLEFVDLDVSPHYIPAEAFTE